MNKTIVISGGGTGGHIYPGICISRELIRYGYEPVFIIKKNDYCIPLLKKENFKYYELEIISLPRKISFKQFLFIYYLLMSFITTIRIFYKIHPLIAVGLGGYTSFPVICVSKLFFIPSLIHEQNYLPGITNRLLSKIATKVAVNFSESVRYFNKKKTVITGNPVRNELFNIDPDNAIREFNLDKNRFTILVFGGSQGAHTINDFIVNNLEYFTEFVDRIQFIHITGEKDFNYVSDAYKSKKIKSKVFAYLYNIGYAYAVADLVICRSGATTVSELIALGKKAILIPYPHATNNHQKYNAEYMSNLGTGIIIEEKDLNIEKFLDIFKKIINKTYPFSLTNHQNTRKKFLDSTPTELLVQNILKLINKNK